MTESSRCWNSHWCFKLFHQLSIIELEKRTSTSARIRRSIPSPTRPSTSPLKFSMPPSANNCGGPSRLTASSTADLSTDTLLAISKRSLMRQANTRRLKLSITACSHTFVPSTSRTHEASMCQISSGCSARTPTFGLAGCTRARGRLHSPSRMSWYHVDGETNTSSRATSMNHRNRPPVPSRRTRFSTRKQPFAFRRLQFYRPAIAANRN